MAINTKQIISNEAQCQIVWTPFQVDYQTGVLSTTSLNNIVISKAVDISNHIIDGVNFSKNLNSAAGSFQFKLGSTKDWAEFIYPGQWCLIYMTNDGNLKLPDKSYDLQLVNAKGYNDLPAMPKSTLPLNNQYIRCIGYIERVTSNLSIGSEGEAIVDYEISGRDIGVIYEETQIWYNYFVFEQFTVDALAKQVKIANFNGLQTLMQLIHNLFFAADQVLPGQALGGQSSLTTIGTQWLLPSSFKDVIGLTFSGTDTFFGHINNLLNLEPTQCVAYIQEITSFLQGTAWSQLKNYSINSLHELFIEVYGNHQKQGPVLTFRPIPWGFNQSGYPTLAKGSAPIPSFYSFYNKKVNNNEAVLINKGDKLVSYSVGRDDHSRYNHFLVRYLNDLLQLNNTIIVLKDRPSPAGRVFPYMDATSVFLHGFRPMHISANTFNGLIVNNQDFGAPADGYPNREILLQYNEVLLDYWYSAINFQSGSIEIIGDVNTKLGTVISTNQEVLGIGNKVFYIEGYEDRFVIGENGETLWTQHIQVSRGVDKQVLSDASNAQLNLITSSNIIGSYIPKM